MRFKSRTNNTQFSKHAKKVMTERYDFSNVMDLSLFVGITRPEKFNWNFSRFSCPVHRIFIKFKARASYHNFFQDPSGTNKDFFLWYDIQ